MYIYTDDDAIVQTLDVAEVNPCANAFFLLMVINSKEFIMEFIYMEKEYVCEYYLQTICRLNDVSMYNVCLFNETKSNSHYKTNGKIVQITLDKQTKKIYQLSIKWVMYSGQLEGIVSYLFPFKLGFNFSTRLWMCQTSVLLFSRMSGVRDVKLGEAVLFCSL